MATSASQPYIAKLGFQDKDRSIDRHGLACEYLFERLLEMEVAPWLNELRQSDLDSAVKTLDANLNQTRERIVDYQKRLKGDPLDGKYWYQRELPQLEAAALEQYDKLQLAIEAKQSFTASYGIETARKDFKAAYAINKPINQRGRNYVVGFADVLLYAYGKRLLGEVKITPQSAESILQQINFYEMHIESGVTYILTDFDCSDLQRMVEGSHIKVYRLGRRFEQWLASRSAFESNEL